MAPRLGRCGVAAALVGIVATGTLVVPTISVSAHSSKHAKGPTTPSGFKVSVFARSTTAFTNPDSIEVSGNNVFVGYQNVTSKTGGDGKFSTVAEYTLSGKLRKTFPALGHMDGLRVDPSTGFVWALSNEDGNPDLTVIDPVGGGGTQYTFDPTPHGGGYDDIAFLGDKVFLSASNPDLVAHPADNVPAVVKITLPVSGSVIHDVTGVINGNALGGQMTDPDSLYINPNTGALQLDDQADQQLVFIANPGGTPTLTSLTIGNAMDDTIFPTSPSGTLLVSDTSGQAIYAFQSKHFDVTRYLSSAPSDSPVSGYVGLISPATGANTPFFTGMVSPHGEAFIPKTNS